MPLFGFFKKNPVQTLEKQYARLMEEAMHIQRSGDLKAYARKIEEAEAVQEEIDKLKATSTK